MADQCNLVLLVFAVTLVDAGGCGKSVTLGGHAVEIGAVPCRRFGSIIACERRIIE
jgi:hypothetical protein